MQTLYLETPRLILRTLTPAYASVVSNFYSANKSFLEPFEPERAPDFYTRNHHRLLLKYDQKGLKDGNLLRVWIFTKKEPRIPIGTISLSNVTRGVFQSCFLGYKISQSHSRKGYMTEALFEMIDYAFTDLELHRLEANIMPSNIPSLEFIKQFGFQEEGLAIRYLKINGVWEDHIHMVLLNE